MSCLAIEKPNNTSVLTEMSKMKGDEKWKLKWMQARKEVQTNVTEAKMGKFIFPPLYSSFFPVYTK